MGTLLGIDPAANTESQHPDGVDIRWKPGQVIPEVDPRARGEYGFFAGGKLKPCSRDELVLRCSRDEIPPIHLVWTPETNRLVPPVDVPFLRKSLQQRALSSNRVTLFIGLIGTIVFGGIFFFCISKQGWDSISALFLINFICIGLLPSIRGFKGLRAARRWDLQGTAAESHQARFQFWVQTRKIFATWGLITCLALVGACQILFGLEASITRSGLVKDAVWRGEVWRLITGPLLHGNAFHFAFNTLAILSLGRTVEVIGHPAYITTVFLLSVVGGSISSLLLLPSVTSVGASGGILGLMGFLAIYGLRTRKFSPGLFRSVMVSVVLIAGMGIVAWEYIDNAAHLGGLLTGALCGLVVKKAAFTTVPMKAGTLLKAIGLVSFVAIVAMSGLAIQRMMAR
jgi:membrane associated rhomboid family serine protease